MNFCGNCKNMYYTQIDEDTDNLQYYCRKCGNIDKITDKKFLCLSEYSEKDTDDAIIQSVNRYIKYDVTLPHIHNIKCPNDSCISNNSPNNDDTNSEDQSKNEVVYIRYNNTDMKYVYLCCHCDNVWKSDLQYSN